MSAFINPILDLSKVVVLALTPSMKDGGDAALFTGALFVGLLILTEVGRRIGLRRSSRDAEGARAGLGAVEGAVFGLLGLLIAFTFSGAASRFDGRRDLIVREANDVGTAYLRLDLLPASAQPELRDLFRRYVDLRLDTYVNLAKGGDVARDLTNTARLQVKIWSAAVAACEASGSAPVTTLVLPALNGMFDIISTRRMAAETHPPEIIFAMLSGLAMVGALLAGFGMAGGRSRSWIHILCFATIMAATVYVILDIEYPRRGLIRIDSADSMLREVRRSME